MTFTYRHKKQIILVCLGLVLLLVIGSFFIYKNYTAENKVEENIVLNTSNSNREAGSTVNNSKDNTVSPDSKLPQTGVNIFLIVLIVAIVAFAVVKIIKYKDIEIK